MLPNKLTLAFEQFEDAFTSLEQYANLVLQGEITGQTAAVLHVSLRRVDRAFRISATTLGLEEFDASPRSARLTYSVSIEDIKEKIEKGAEFIKKLITHLMQFFAQLREAYQEMMSGLIDKISAYENKIRNLVSDKPSQTEYTVPHAGRLYSGKEFVGQDLTPAKKLVEWLKNKYGPNLLKLFEDVYHTLNVYDFESGNIEDFKAQLDSNMEPKLMPNETLAWVDGKDIHVSNGFKLMFQTNNLSPDEEVVVPVRQKNELMQFISQAKDVSNTLSEFTRIDNSLNKAVDDIAKLENRRSSTMEAAMLQVQCEVYTLQTTQRLMQTGLPAVYAAIDKALNDKLALVDKELSFYSKNKEAA